MYLRMFTLTNMAQNGTRLSVRYIALVNMSLLRIIGKAATSLHTGMIFPFDCYH